VKSVGELPASGQKENDVTERHDLASIAQTQTASIQTVIDLIRSAPFPMFILLGQDRRLIYNDAYVPVLGARHPAAMEKPFFEVWPEVRSVVEPVIERAFVGEPSHFEDLPVVLHRPDPEPAWFTFSYSPIRNEKTDIVGTLCICTETTEAVTARERQTFLISLEKSFRGIDDPFEIIETAQAALGTYLGVSRVGYGTVDDTGRYFTTKRNWSDGSVQNEDGTHDLTAFGNTIFDALRRGIPSKVTDAWTDPREGAEGAAAAFAALQVRSAVTVPLIKGDRFVAALYVHHREPRQWTEGDLTLIRDVAERTWSAVERAYAQADLHALSRRQASASTV
jgi:GAF domain-containing protein